MNDLFSYIFSNMKNADSELRIINKALRTQAALNLVFAGVVWFTVAHIEKQQIEIEKLTKKVEELKKEKGE
jgi:hypothetical protein